MSRRIRKMLLCLWAPLVCFVSITSVQIADADTIALTDWSGVEYSVSTYAY
jgi:hypothetical protein